MIKKNGWYRRIVAFALAGVMAVSMLGTGIVVKASDLSNTDSMTGQFVSGILINEDQFPDENFRKYVSDKFDKDGNGALSKEEIAKVTKIECSFSAIYDITGIECFDSLVYLDCSYNPISELDLSNNTKLTKLHCSSNRIKELDVSYLSELVELSCADCYLTELNVSKNKELQILTCFGNEELTKLDVSNNTKLKRLECGTCGIEELDLSKNVELTELWCDQGKIKKLDLSKCTELTDIMCRYNQLEELDVSKNTKLKYLNCAGNQINELDVTANKELGGLYCYGNQLSELNVRNNTKLVYLECDNNNIKELDVSCNTELERLYCGKNQLEVLDVSNNTKLNNENVSADTSVDIIFDKDDIEVFVAPEIDVYYRTHIQNDGWEGIENNIKTWKKDGVMSGTSGRALRLEGINIVVTPETSCPELDLGIQYTTHCQDYGWLPWSADGDMNGTEGESKRLEAIEIRLIGEHKDLYDVYYRVHAQDYGWLGWAKNGEPSGTAGKAKRLEGIQIQVVKKDTTPNWNVDKITSDYSDAFYAAPGSSPIVNYPDTSNQNPVIPGADKPNVVYKTHVQNDGWQCWKYNGQMSGTSGRSLRLEGINIKLSNRPCDGGIVYTTHVQNIGWQGDINNSSTWKANGAMAGTSGRSLRLEAICIALTGEMADKYDVYYRVHAQDYGWLGWAKNGAPAGTAGYSKRLEGIQIVLVKKGDSAPANNYGGIVANDTREYIEN